MVDQRIENEQSLNALITIAKRFHKLWRLLDQFKSQTKALKLTPNLLHTVDALNVVLYVAKQCFQVTMMMFANKMCL